MGLSMIHGITHTCGGHIRLVSTPGEGTIFSLLLPMISHDNMGVVKTNVAENDVTTDKERKHGVIMVVDDDASVAH